MKEKPKYPGERLTANGNQLVSYHTEARVTDGGVYYPITPSTEGGELYQQSFAEGNLNVFGRSTTAIEAEPSPTRYADDGWSILRRAKVFLMPRSSIITRLGRPRL